MREESSVLGAKLEALREKRGFPGITGAVVTADGREFIASAGLADPDAKVAMPPDAVMLQASVGKMYLGAIARVLSDQGVVALDAPVSHYLNSRPWFARLPNHGTMQLRHLLSHSAGLQDYMHVPAFGPLARNLISDPDLFWERESAAQFRG